jgi:putative phosphoesterase
MLGVISNSDGRAESVASAVNIFKSAGAEYVIHLGDVGGRHVLDALGENVHAAFVWGDRDRDRMGLLRYAHSIGVECMGLMGDLDIDGKKIAVLHGDDRKLMRKLLDEQQHDYLLCGHEATVEDYKVGKTRILNPGSLRGAQSGSALLLNPGDGKIQLVPI